MEEIINYIVFILLILLLFLSLAHKRFKINGVKRYATLLQSAFMGIIYIVTILFKNNKISVYLALLLTVLVIAVTIKLRKKVFPYIFKCEKCGNRLNFKHILFYDDLFCEKCS